MERFCALLCLAGSLAQCHEGSCRNQGSLFLQKEMARVAQLGMEEEVANLLKEGLTSNRSRARDARFLLRASFGPTRATLQALEHLSYGAWIQQQMQVPPEYLRPFYRARVNPWYEAAEEAISDFRPRTACAVGSRWHVHVFTFEDVKKQVKIQSNQILVDNLFRSDVAVGVLGSRWSGLEGYVGYVCFVEEGVGQDIHISTSSDCSGKQAMPNPAIHLVDPAKYLVTALPFSHAPWGSGTLLLQNYSEPCDLEGKDFIQVLGRFYAFDLRVELKDNTPQTPSSTGSEVPRCVAVTFLNGASCRTEPLAEGPMVPGLLAEVHDLFGTRDASFISETGSMPTFSFVDDQISYGSTSSRWWPTMDDDYFAVKWSGEMAIQTAGLYTFFLKSNDGSRLVIDGQQVIDNGGYHSTNEESGELNLTAGSHTLLVEYFQGTSTSNIEFKWQGPDSGEVKQLVPGSVFSTKPASKCPDCGSPGEVANQPNLGHQFRFFTTEDHIDSDLDNHFFDRMDRELSKSAVWTAKAMGAEDQLRQRVAWALSQIFVVSANGFGGDSRTEVWLNYYDMFLRHAFGNFRDLLREVTYNPLMGEYLTNTGSSSYDHNGRFPNENYAREIMQLFTIGLDMLHPNGTAKVTAAGDKVPTYGMEEIVSFSKVFTGFKQRPFRANIENYDDDNLIDPLKVSAGRHDKHPKMDLYGGYLGDGYPMCSDFVGLVSKGSKFLYHTGFLDNALELPADSQLRTALCASDGAGCVYPAAVELTEDLVCGGAECGATVRAVKVDGRFYRYVPPPCVQNYVSPLVVNGSSYYPLGPGQYCPEGSLVTDYAECEAAILAVHGGHDGNPKTSATQWAPKGCSWRSNRMYINPHETGRASGGSYQPICKAYVWVHTDGRVSIEGSEANNFKVHWTGPVPAGQQLISVSSAAVFSAVPSKAEVLALPVGAPKPSVACSVCGDVQVFHPANDGPAIGSSAVFGVEGRYFRNLRHSVDLGSASFRNPPVFLKAQKGLLAEEAALAEVECLLDQLFQHNNTAVFIGKRLIQRFGTSNPSAAYVEAVAKAFRTGAIASGEVFSGKYGDLGATVAEILLHEHGDFEGHLHRQFHGSLREPMLKLIHFLRSMEYVDAKQELVVFEELQDVLGQFPFQSPSVFNFYLADFNLPEPEPENASMNMTGGLPEPEPEAEALVAPELQILIPPHFIGFLNGMSSMIKYGVNYKCDAVRGFGERANPYVGLESRDVCPMGTFQVPDLGENETLQELDVLLTGGRLTDVAKEAARRAYRTAPASEKMKRAQTAVMMTPEFNTFGDPLPKAEARPELNASQASAQLPYRATVFLFLAGGADTWNMLVPQNCDLYQEYVDVRTDLHLNPSDLIEVNVSGQPCAKFGIHGSYGYLKQLYDEKDLAFMTNIGSLVEPLTKEQYRSSSKQTCVGLFSHSDQQTGAQTLQCQTPGNTPRGAGGRMADALNAQNPPVQAASFSVAGSAIFAQGVVTNRQIVSEEGNKRFGEFELWRETISNITKQQHANVFSEQYTKIFLDSLRGTEELGRAFEEVELATNYDTSSKLAKQLSQVAKLMKVREVRKAERDFFFVQVGGWDMHSNLLTSLTNKFADINSALEGFVAEMKAQNIWNSVVLASSSEFARTLDSNGGGSDHAWAGQHFVIGGKVRGGKVLNKYPSTLKEGAYNDIGRGRLIPEYPWESMLVPIAEWMGLNTADGASMTQVFPNFARFNSSTVQGADFLFKP